MNLTDELRKLADLRAAGSLTEGEFTEAKRRVLTGGGTGATPPPSTPKEEDAPTETEPLQEKFYQSSRWSAGNFFFPDSLALASDGLLFRKRSLFGSREEHINYQAVASLRVKNGFLLSTLSIETTGGSQPIFINGLWKSDARQIQEVLRSFQREA